MHTTLIFTKFSITHISVKSIISISIFHQHLPAYFQIWWLFLLFELFTVVCWLHILFWPLWWFITLVWVSFLLRTLVAVIGTVRGFTFAGNTKVWATFTTRRSEILLYRSWSAGRRRCRLCTGGGVLTLAFLCSSLKV